MPDIDRFAIIPLPANGPTPVDAIAVGGLNAVMEQIVDSRARNDLEDMINRAAEAQEQEQQRQDREFDEHHSLVQRLCTGIDHMVRRIDSLEEFPPRTMEARCRVRGRRDVLGAPR